MTAGAIVANRAQIGTGVSSSGVPLTSRRHHYSHKAGAISALQFIDLNWYYTDSEIALAGTYTMKKFVEYPVGTFTQVTWGGQPTVTVAAGGQVKSDPVNITIPPDTLFYERTVLTAKSLTTLAPIIILPATPSALGALDGFEAADAGTTTVGTILLAATGTTNAFGSAAIIGTVAALNARSAVIVGDSINWGQADITGVGAKGGSGYVARLLVPVMPWVKTGNPGQTAGQVAAGHARLDTFIAAIGYTDIICEYGGGDLRVGSSLGATQGYMQTVLGLFTCPRKILCTLLPRTDNNGSYASQTVKTDGSWAQAANYNNWVRGLPTNVTGFIDAADASMTARDSGLWKTIGAAAAPPTDGVHPSSPWADYIASQLAYA